jgi:hypothetical protein|tara:strand:+ start:1387 stop:2160 length:774 start_codon:yes stop_codon:yes gene_type:complete
MTLLFNTQLQKYKSWKDINNNKTIVNTKLVKNTSASSNSNLQVEKNKCVLHKSQFRAKPMKHYRRVYNDNNSISNMSMVGTLDNPINSVLTTSESSNLCINKNFEYVLINKTCDNGFCNANLIIKPASTNIDNNYCSTNKEYLYKKCKTYQQNIYDFNKNKCTQNNDCSNVVKYSNKKYMMNEPITSSARIANIKYQTCLGKDVVCSNNKIYNDFFIELKLKKELDVDNKCNNVLNKIAGVCNENKFKGGKKIRLLQ